jgi:hypothetical protein
MARVLSYVLDLLLIVEHEPALGTEHLPVWLWLDEFDLIDEVFPLFAILFNHFLFNSENLWTWYLSQVLYNFIIIHRLCIISHSVIIWSGSALEYKGGGSSTCWQFGGRSHFQLGHLVLRVKNISDEVIEVTLWRYGEMSSLDRDHCTHSSPDTSPNWATR